MCSLIFPFLGWRCDPSTLTPDYSAHVSLRPGKASQPGCSAVQSSRDVDTHPSGPPLSLVTEETSGNLKVGKEEVNLSNIPVPRVN